MGILVSTPRCAAFPQALLSLLLPMEAPPYAQHCDGGHSRHGSCSQVGTALAHTAHHPLLHSPKAPQHNTTESIPRETIYVEYKNLTSYPALAFHATAYTMLPPHGSEMGNSQEAPRNGSPNEGPSTFLCVDGFPFRPLAGDLLSIVRTTATTMAHGSLPPSPPPVCFPPFLLNKGALSEGSLLIHPRSSAQTAIKKRCFFFSLYQFVLPKISPWAGTDWVLEWGLPCLVCLHYLRVIFTQTWANGMIN